MHTARLRKVGGSVMLAVPPPFLEELHLQPGARVCIEVEGGRLVVEPQGRPRYTLDELLSLCDPDAAPTLEDLEWVADRPVGREQL